MSYENQTTGYRRFTEVEIAEARQTEIVTVAEALGYRTKRVGKYYELQEHDSLRIFPNNTYCRFANVIGGKPETGSVIDFEEGIIYVRHTLVYYDHGGGKGCHYEIHTPKTLGHKDVETTLNVYTHVSKDLQKQAFDELQRKMKKDRRGSDESED